MDLNQFINNGPSEVVVDSWKDFIIGGILFIGFIALSVYFG